jgi:hypothetical protein
MYQNGYLNLFSGPVDRSALNVFNNPFSKRFGVRRDIYFCKRAELSHEIIYYFYNTKFLTAKIDAMF